MSAFACSSAYPTRKTSGTRQFPVLSPFVRLCLPQAGQLRELSVYPTRKASGTDYSHRKTCFNRQVRVGVPVKGMKPLKKLEKIPHTYFASIPTLGRMTLPAVRSVMDVSPAKLHRQSVVRSHGGTGKVMYKICKGRQKNINRPVPLRKHFVTQECWWLRNSSCVRFCCWFCSRLPDR